MAEGKYGPLRPVLVDRQPGSTEVTPLPAKWDDDEPLFLFRAQDQLSTHAVWAYYEVLRQHGLHKQAMAVENQWRAMVDWQRAHPDQVKLPD